MDKNNYLLDRLDFIEFKQNILFLKPPQHRIQLFYELSIEDYFKIKNYTNDCCDRIINNECFSLNDFSKGLSEIWEPSKSYPLSATLVAQSLMPRDIYKNLST